MFGGTTISLILPKLILSVARDGILTFYFQQCENRTAIKLTTQGKSAAFNDEPAKTKTKFSVCELIKKFKERPGEKTRRGSPDKLRLLDFHFRASFFELFLGSIRVSLVRAFQHGLRSAFDQRLGFRQSEAGLDFTNGFDRRNLFIRRSRNEDHVKRVLRSGSRSSTTSGSATGSGNRDRRGGANAPFGFKLFHQVGGFQDRQLAQFFHDVSDVSHITFLSVVSSSAAATANFSSQPANRRFTLLLFVNPFRKNETEIVIRISPISL
jgi:hypothetical protein